MKKYFKLMLSAAIVATAIVACSKNDSSDGILDTSVKKVSFNATQVSPVTKTVFGEKSGTTYPVLWKTGDKVALSLNYANKKTATVTASSDERSATFEAEFSDDKSGEYTYLALCPESSFISISKDDKKVQFNIPSSQTPSLASVDPAAQILVAKSAKTTTFESNASLHFGHLLAYGKFKLDQIPETVTINSIEIVPSEGNFTGRYFVFPETGNLTESSVTKSVTIQTTTLLEEKTAGGLKNADLVFWFAINPTDLSGKEITFTINTDAGPFVKEFTFPSNKGNFQRGRVASFTLDMTGITPGVTTNYVRVDNYADLKNGAEVIIASLTEDFAVSVTQNTNNRGQAAVTKNSDGNLIISPGSEVQKFIVEPGTVDNSVAFKCIDKNVDKYVGAVASQNYFRSFDASADNTSFDVTLISGEAVLMANGCDRYLRYNKDNSIFSCYGITSSVTGKVAIFAREGTGGGKFIDERAATPVIEFDNATNTVTITSTTPTRRSCWE